MAGRPAKFSSAVAACGTHRTQGRPAPAWACMKPLRICVEMSLTAPAHMQASDGAPADRGRADALVRQVQCGWWSTLASAPAGKQWRGTWRVRQEHGRRSGRHADVLEHVKVLRDHHHLHAVCCQPRGHRGSCASCAGQAVAPCPARQTAEQGVRTSMTSLLLMSVTSPATEGVGLAQRAGMPLQPDWTHRAHGNSAPPVQLQARRAHAQS